jgi:hypothetical protein
MSGALLAGEPRRVWHSPVSEGGRRHGRAAPEAPTDRRWSSDGRTGSGMSLEERLTAVWQHLCRGATAECPVCQGDMRPTDATGRCDDCGSALT